MPKIGVLSICAVPPWTIPSLRKLDLIPGPVPSRSGLAADSRLRRWLQYRIHQRTDNAPAPSCFPPYGTPRTPPEITVPAIVERSVLDRGWWHGCPELELSSISSALLVVHRAR